MRFLIVLVFVLSGSLKVYSTTASSSSAGRCSSSNPSALAYLTARFYSNFLDKNTGKTLTARLTVQLEQVQKSVWMIGDHNPHGTAFFVSPNHVVTSWHVISDKAVSSLSLCREGSERRLSVQRLVSVSALYDLALLEVEKGAVSYLQVRKNLVSDEEELVLLGYPDGIFEYTFNTSPLKAFEGDDIYTHFFVNRVYLHGNSGGPILDANNRVAGVATQASVNYISMIKESVLRDFIAGDVGLSCEGRDPEACTKEAIGGLQKKAKRGDQIAQYRLAILYFNGLGVQKDFSLALEWSHHSAQQGYVPAQYMLGMMYYKGKGVPRHFSLALKWFRRLVKQGHAPAQYMLGMMYYKGDGVGQDFFLALKWFRHSAEQGYAPAEQFFQ